jgi:hypothetical protein
MGERRGVYRVLVGKGVGKIPVGRPRSNWKDNVRLDLKEIGWRRLDWPFLVPNRDIGGPCERDNEPSGSVKCAEFLA